MSGAVLGKLAESVAEALHRFYCITQWHRSPFDPQNDDAAYLHRCVFSPNVERVSGADSSLSPSTTL